MEPARDVVETLTALGVEATYAASGAVIVRLPSHKRGIVAVHLSFEERSVQLQAFVMRGPDRAHEEIYARLLRRHFDRSRWRFALDDDGDIYLVTRTDIEGLSDRLDGLLGELSVIVDETYEGMLRAGFDVPPDVVVTRPG